MVESQADGSAKCQAMGGRLAVVDDDAERAAIKQYIADNGVGNVFIAGTDGAEEGKWVTESGKPLIYTHYYSNQPNGGTVENCLVLAGGWFHDGACMSTGWVSKVLCEQ